MRDPFAGYDAWLERPFQEECERAEAYQNWCEAHDLDPESMDAKDAYNDYIDSQWEDFEDWDEPDEDIYDEDAHFEPWDED